VRLLLIGSRGQLGSDLVPALRGRVDLHCVDHDRLDIGDRASVAAALEAARPDLVLNTAAFNRVDDCEQHFERALSVNAVGPLLLAQACRAAGAVLLHISTDYVFDGAVPRPRREDECPLPRSAYGISKRAGELAVLAECADAYVVRTSGLYGLAGSSGKGGNFVETMLRLAGEGRQLSVVDDQVLGPTSTADLAGKLVKLIERIALTERRPAPGVYHVTNAGACSWFEFARAIFELADLEVDLRPQSTAQLGAPAQRPAYSVLANDRLAAEGIAPLRHWREALADYLAARAERCAAELTSTGD
jgi:dTDP-4-dehydrorhamnose reductase